MRARSRIPVLALAIATIAPAAARAQPTAAPAEDAPLSEPLRMALAFENGAIGRDLSQYAIELRIDTDETQLRVTHVASGASRVTPLGMSLGELDPRSLAMVATSLMDELDEAIAAERPAAPVERPRESLAAPEVARPPVLDPVADPDERPAARDDDGPYLTLEVGPLMLFDLGVQRSMAGAMARASGGVRLGILRLSMSLGGGSFEESRERFVPFGLGCLDGALSLTGGELYATQLMLGVQGCVSAAQHRTENDEVAVAGAMAGAYGAVLLPTPSGIRLGVRLDGDVWIADALATSALVHAGEPELYRVAIALSLVAQL
ncbi:MAG: hypothetical protein AB7S26_05350 [Sandaracinaceae bacterium]